MRSTKSMNFDTDARPVDGERLPRTRSARFPQIPRAINTGSALRTSSPCLAFRWLFVVVCIGALPFLALIFRVVHEVRDVRFLHHAQILI